MPRIYPALTALLATTLVTSALAAPPKVHVITFGKWTTVEWVPGTGDNKSVTLKVRPLVVDGRPKEHFLCSPHEVTERLFVVRRVFRANDSLSEESRPPRSQSQRAECMRVDRSTRHLSPLL